MLTTAIITGSFGMSAKDKKKAEKAAKAGGKEDIAPVVEEPPPPPPEPLAADPADDFGWGTSKKVGTYVQCAAARIVLIAAW